jgi:hypothetical protein
LWNPERGRKIERIGNIMFRKLLISAAFILALICTSCIWFQTKIKSDLPAVSQTLTAVNTNINKNAKDAKTNVTEAKNIVITEANKVKTDHPDSATNLGSAAGNLTIAGTDIDNIITENAKIPPVVKEVEQGSTDIKNLQKENIELKAANSDIYNKIFTIGIVIGGIILLGGIAAAVWGSSIKNGIIIAACGLGMCGICGAMLEYKQYIIYGSIIALALGVVAAIVYIYHKNKVEKLAKQVVDGYDNIKKEIKVNPKLVEVKDEVLNTISTTMQKAQQDKTTAKIIQTFQNKK